MSLFLMANPIIAFNIIHSFKSNIGDIFIKNEKRVGIKRNPYAMTVKVKRLARFGRLPDIGQVTGKGELLSNHK